MVNKLLKVSENQLLPIVSNDYLYQILMLELDLNQ
jgi:hypothetical protein